MMALPPLFVVDADASPVAGELVASKLAAAPLALPAVPSAAAAAAAAAVAAGRTRPGVPSSPRRPT